MSEPRTVAADAVPRWRKSPVGAERAPNGEWHLRVWAPACTRLTVSIAEERARTVELACEDGGYFAGSLGELPSGTRYVLHLDGGPARPDPASRWQPDGPHGSSALVDASEYQWRDRAWPGVRNDGQVICELHVGTFTREGTFAAAAKKLPLLAEVGITTVEVLPIAEFPGRFGWGYDGVALYAPSHLYGSPDDLRAFVDAAHANGISVLLDVVYNHFGPDGCYLRDFAPEFFKGSTEWGDAINFDGAENVHVREFFVANAAYWVRDFHLDGLRLDATQQMFDSSSPHILAEIADAVHAAGGTRRTYVVGENEPQRARHVRARGAGGEGLDALWNDDFHHSALVAVTGRNEAYYSDYRGTPQELVSTAKYGFLFQGQWYRWQNGRRGMPAFDIGPEQFVNFLENHDQVANSAFGRRLHQVTSPGRFRAMTAALLLFPQTPMLFQGQEFGSSSPFLYFADHTPELAALVRKGRAEFVAQFPSIATSEVRAVLPEPDDSATFERCKIDWSERERHPEALRLHRDLIALRRSEPVLQGGRDARLGIHGIDGAVIGPQAFVIRWFGATDDGSDDRLLVVNLGARLQLEVVAEPLLATPADARWRVRWSSEAVGYGGDGTPVVDSDDGGWYVPAECALLLHPVPQRDAEPAPRPKRFEREDR